MPTRCWSSPPEYNGSIPGLLKNAVDWLSRPFGDSALKGKPLAVIGAAPGRYGGVCAHDEHAQAAADVRDVVARPAAEVG